LRLTRRDHAGVGSLELVDTGGRLALWRYTLGQDSAAGCLIDRFDRWREFFASGVGPPPPEYAGCSTRAAAGFSTTSSSDRLIPICHGNSMSRGQGKTFPSQTLEGQPPWERGVRE
jgi:hypothetical protein